MFPTSGGQYYYVAILAPRQYRRYLSYITGWLCAITWQIGVAGGVYVAATIIQGLFVLNIETYDYQRWHGTLLTLALLLITILFNTFLARKLPLVECLFVILHILGILVFIPLWIMAPRREGGAPLVEFYNGSGWPTVVLSTIVGIVAPASSLIGFDCSVHMAEETKDSSRTVPITLLFGYTTNVFLGFFAIVSFIYTLGPLDVALNSPTGYPFIDLFYSGTQSIAAAIVISSLIIILQTAGGIAALAAASRQLWSFARSGGVPFSRFFAPDHLAYDIPLNAVLFSCTLSVLVALINIGSTEALGIILSIYNSALIASYLITIGCVLLHRLRGRRLPKSRYSLGRWGTLVNILALVFSFPIWVFSFFPAIANPTPALMNWAVMLVGGITFFATVYYVAYGRKVYDPPNLTVEDYIERYEASSAPSETEASAVVDEKVPDAMVEEAEKKYT